MPVVESTLRGALMQATEVSKLEPDELVEAWCLSKYDVFTRSESVSMYTVVSGTLSGHSKTRFTADPGL